MKRKHHTKSVGPFAPPEKPKRAKRQGKKSKNLGGAPAYVPTDQDRAVVIALAGFGHGVEAIGDHLGLSHPTVRKAFKKELRTARLNLHAMAGGALVYNLKANKWDAVKYVHATLGAKFGWVEPQKHEHSGPEGAPIPVRISSLSDSQLAQLADRLSKG